jgi:hypothetical protein
VQPGFETLRRVLRACGFDICDTLVRVPGANGPDDASRS